MVNGSVLAPRGTRGCAGEQVRADNHGDINTQQKKTGPDEDVWTGSVLISGLTEHKQVQRVRIQIKVTEWAEL